MNPALLDRVIEIAVDEGVAPPRKQTLRATMKPFLQSVYGTHRDLVGSRKGQAVEYLACLYFERHHANAETWAALDALEDGAPIT